jgi:hypothetical protein
MHERFRRITLPVGQPVLSHLGAEATPVQFTQLACSSMCPLGTRARWWPNKRRTRHARRFAPS